MSVGLETVLQELSLSWCLVVGWVLLVCLTIGEMCPVPKRSNLNICDNWCEISLLDVGGKLLQGRLQIIAESVLPDPQCRLC